MYRVCHEVLSLRDQLMLKQSANLVECLEEDRHLVGLEWRRSTSRRVDRGSSGSVSRDVVTTLIGNRVVWVCRKESVNRSLVLLVRVWPRTSRLRRNDTGSRAGDVGVGVGARTVGERVDWGRRTAGESRVKRRVVWGRGSQAGVVGGGTWAGGGVDACADCAVDEAAEGVSEAVGDTAEETTEETGERVGTVVC